METTKSTKTSHGSSPRSITVTHHQHFRESLAGHLDPERTRIRCERLLRNHLGEGGFAAFLRSRQPAFQDMTGQDILELRSTELLERLELLERGDA